MWAMLLGLLSTWLIVSTLYGLFVATPHIGPDSCGTVTNPANYAEAVNTFETLTAGTLPRYDNPSRLALANLRNRATRAELECPRMLRNVQIAAVLASSAILAIGGTIWFALRTRAGRAANQREIEPRI